MTDFHDRLYTAAQVRELDRRAIEEHGISGFTLMQRAGERAFRELLEHWPDVRRLEVFCGTGNNGGDGFVLAALAMEAGLDVHVWLNGSTAAVTGDARSALDLARSKQVPVQPVENFSQFSAPDDHCVIVDALLGTGLKGRVREDARRLIGLINDSECPILAIDIPSGLCSDTGQELGGAVQADVTVTFIGLKAGQFNASGPSRCGHLCFDNLDVPAAVYSPAPAP